MKGRLGFPQFLAFINKATMRIQKNKKTKNLLKREQKIKNFPKGHKKVQNTLKFLLMTEDAHDVHCRNCKYVEKWKWESLNLTSISFCLFFCLTS